MTILVTGGAGYIGSHVCKALALAGFLPVAYDNLSQGHAWAVKWGPLEAHELCHRKYLEAAFEKYQPVAVIHLAASIDARASLKDPKHYYCNNVATSLVLLETMCKYGIKTLVYSSSAAIYGTPHYLPIDEKHPQIPLSPYGRSKKLVEEVLDDYFHADGLVTAALRFFNAAGADLENQIGEAHKPETHLIPSLIETALGKRAELTLYGNAVRDYVHVSDLAEAHVKAVQKLLKEKRNLKLNLGSGRGFATREILDELKKFSQKPIAITQVDQLATDPVTLIADIRRAQNEIDWTPQHSDLKTILATAWEWHSK